MKRTIGIIVLLSGFALLTVCNKPKLPASDPVITMGHGVMIGEDGEQIEVTESFIRTVQQYYLNKLFTSIENKETNHYFSPSQIGETQNIIRKEVKDEVLANALMIDWLLEKSIPKSELAHLTNVNNALRWKYVLEIEKDGVKPNDNWWAKGLSDEVAKMLETKIDLSLVMKTNKTFSSYCEECLEAGVPVPKFVFGEEWTYEGEVTNEFLNPGSIAELWSYESESPKGVCLALPRHEEGKDSAGILGIICLGTESNNACFFDNPSGVKFKLNEKTDFRNFLGGVDLVLNGQGVCSDCHAGENPFVVHPEQQAFKNIQNIIKPQDWFKPLVIATWPQNPGPTNILAAIPSPGKCNSCHVQGSAGRFPEVSSELLGYCTLVLKEALDSPQNTMPPYGLKISNFAAHIDTLKASCRLLPSDPGNLVSWIGQDDPLILSRPQIIDPLYQCVKSVAVSGAVLDAKVILSVNGREVAVVSPARSPLYIEFSDLDSPLQVGDQVSARQEIGGVSSPPSSVVTVRDYKIDYPQGLPAPVIDPNLIYQCAEVIGVRHVPGATVTVYKNGTYVGQNSSAGWSIVFVGTIKKGDKFSAGISLCNDKSPMSEVVEAVAAPSKISRALLNPPYVFVDQELVSVYNLTNGSTTNIGVSGFGTIGGFSVPNSLYDYFDIKTRLGRPLAGNDHLWVSQELCNLTSTLEIPDAIACQELPAPRIQQPYIGNGYVIVRQSVPGARVRIYNFFGEELGDGSGTVILLSRVLKSTDAYLIAVQQVGACTSKEGHQVMIR